MPDKIVDPDHRLPAEMLRKLRSRLPPWIPDADAVANDIMMNLSKQWLGKNDLGIMAGLIISAVAMLEAHHQGEVKRGLVRKGSYEDLIKMAHDILDITAKVMHE
jgi:hypothetical protein